MAGLVLVVDDNEAFRDLATRVFTSWGLRVVQAGTVDEAVLRASEDRPDIAVVDIGLPDGDGFSLTRQLVALLRQVRVVIVSTDADVGNGFAAREAGASGFFAKEDLLNPRVRTLVSGR